MTVVTGRKRSTRRHPTDVGTKGAAGAAHEEDEEEKELRRVTEDGSVLETLYGAGDAVRSLSLAERKALFEVGVHEHVSALTELLFPEEDGVSPRVNIDVSV